MTFKYNPGFSSDEDLISAFVVREKELQQILQTLQENTGRTYQHLLLVGARGTGKTMLVRRVAAEVRRSEPLNQHWYPLVFGEESYYGILNAGDFWLVVLKRLAKQNPESQWERVYEELLGEKDKDDKRLQKRAIAKLMDFADEQGKQILLIVENLNMLFDEQMSDGDDWDLRHTLQNEPRLMLLGTATQRFNEIDNVEKAWFEFFALHTLEPLNSNDCRKLWKSVTAEDLSENRIKPLKILTGGNPRLLKIIADFAKEMSFHSLMSNLTQLIDEHTSFFKSLLEELPPTERKVFITLLEKWEPSSTNDIAKASRLDVSKVSSLLNRLVQRGAVEVSGSEKKYYQVVERLFNIYYLMRQNGDSKNQVKFVIDFMTSFYEEDELSESILFLIKEFQKLSSEYGNQIINTIDIAFSKLNNNNRKSEILFATSDDFFAKANLPGALGVNDYIGFRNFVRYKRTNELSELESSFNNYLSKFPDDALVLELLGFLLHKTPNRSEEAISVYLRAIEKDSTFVLPWVQLGIIKYEINRDFQGAEEAFLKAIKMKPKYDWAWVNYSRIIGEGHYSKKTEKVIDELISSSGNDSWAKTLSGMILFEKNKDFDRAQQIFREVNDRDPEFALAWQQLIRLHHKRGRLLQQWSKELTEVKDVISGTCKYMWLSPDIIDFIIDAAASGYAEQAVNTINDSTAVAKLRPLIVGLRIFLGEERPLVAQEIFEIGQDVADRIRTKQAELANSSLTT